MSPPDRWAAACAALSEADPAMARAVAELGPCGLVVRRAAGGAFGALVRTICHQQLAGAAAATIHGRVAAVYGGRPSPAAVAATPDDVLRAAGLSGAKVASVKDLAVRALDGRLRLRGWSRLTDDEIVAQLCTVRGIGPWSAQMFLMFQLNRPDVWPVGDLGVRAGWARIHGMDAMPGPSELLEMGEACRPFRSVAAWYCWRIMDGPAPPNVSGAAAAW